LTSFWVVDVADDNININNINNINNKRAKRTNKQTNKLTDTRFRFQTKQTPYLKFQTARQQQQQHQNKQTK